MSSIIVLFLLIGFFSSAQTVNLKGYTTATRGGVGNIPAFNWSIPAGQNRLMIVMVNFERDHRPNGVGSNYPGGTAFIAPSILVGGNEVSVNEDHYLYTGYWSNKSDAFNWPIAEHTDHLNIYTMSEADGLPTGSTNFNFSNFNGGKTSADEMSVTILVYENVSASNPIQEVKYHWNYDIPDDETNLLTLSGDAVDAPTGRVAADVLYVSLFGVSTHTSGVSASGWAQQLPLTNVTNTTGSPYSRSGYSEADGMSTRVHHRNYSSGNPSITYTRSSNISDKLQGSLGIIYALKPIAKPGISGTVFRDNDGLPVNGGGGGGVYNSTGSNILHVNVLNAAGTTVIATAQVNSSGTFNILDGGNLVEGTTYVLQLSKNKGTVGSTAPAKELHTNWTTVGESRNSSGTTDGSPDGLLTITLGDTNSTTNRFGVTETLCTPPTINTQPAGATYCQNRTATALSVTATGAASYQWYRNTTSSTTGGTAVGTNSSYTPVITATGTFYYYVIVSNGTCSLPSDSVAIIVNPTTATPVASATTLVNPCPVATANLTTLQPAVVSGQSYEWHTVATNPTAGTKVANPGAVSVSGLYYLYSKADTGGCFSNASNAVTVTITPCTTCTSSGVTSVNLNSRYTGTLPAGVVLEWWTSPTRDLPPTPGTKVLDPTNVTVSGTYYAFFYDTVNNCYNTDNSTAAVVVNILPPCATCTNPGSTAIGGNPTKVGITVQQKQETWPESIKNGFIALQSQNKGMVITRVATVGGGTGGAPNLTTDSIKDPKEGMLVYDLTADCVKLYNGTIWKCLAKDCL